MKTKTNSLLNLFKFEIIKYTYAKKPDEIIVSKKLFTGTFRMNRADHSPLQIINEYYKQKIQIIILKLFGWEMYIKGALNKKSDKEKLSNGKYSLSQSKLHSVEEAWVRQFKTK